MTRVVGWIVGGTLFLGMFVPTLAPAGIWWLSIPVGAGCLIAFAAYILAWKPGDPNECLVLDEIGFRNDAADEVRGPVRRVPIEAASPAPERRLCFVRGTF